MVRTTAWSAILLLAAGGAGTGPALGGRGMVLAEAEIDLLPGSGGLVASIPLGEGDAVGPGDAVVVLDDAEEAASAAQAKVNLEVAELKLRKEKARPLPEDLEKCAAEYEEAKSALLLAEKTVSAELKLADGGIVSELGRQKSERYLESEKSKADRKRIDLEILKRGARPEELRMAELEVESRRILHATALRAQARRRVAPSREGRGLVSRVSVRQGQWVGGTAAVAQVVYIDRLRVDLELPGTAALGLRRGAKATLRTKAFPDAVLEGNVDRIAPVVDAGSGTVRVVLSFANPGHRVRPGVEGDVEIAP